MFNTKNIYLLIFFVIIELFVLKLLLDLDVSVLICLHDKYAPWSRVNYFLIGRGGWGIHDNVGSLFLFARIKTSNRHIEGWCSRWKWSNLNVLRTSGRKVVGLTFFNWHAYLRAETPFGEIIKDAIVFHKSWRLSNIRANLIKNKSISCWLETW